MSLSSNDNKNKTLIFVYGTLKNGFPNHHLLEALTQSNDAVFIGPHHTLKPFPLVCGPLGIPFLINLPGSGHRVRGELYSVSAKGLPVLDELEGVTRGHYERLPIQVVPAAEEVVVEAEAYFADRSFGEEMWEKSGRVGMGEYLDKEGEKYVRVGDRDVGLNLRDYITSFLNDHGHLHPISA